MSEWTEKRTTRDKLLDRERKAVGYLSEWTEKRTTRDKLLDRERKAVGYLSEWTEDSQRQACR